VRAASCLLILLVITSFASAQSDVSTRPITGLRDDRPANVALVGADVVIRPGALLGDATILVQETAITAVGKEIDVPAGFQVIDCQNKRVYPGLIDAWSEVEVPIEAAESGYWNRNVTPRLNAANEAVALADASKLRSQGITTRLVAPRGGIVKGSSAVVLLDGQYSGRSLLVKHAWQHLQLTVPRGSRRASYPNSPMGATALLRQSLYDARWYREAWDAYRANTQLPRPETNLDLQALSDAMLRDTFVIDAPNERMAIRAESVANEFAIKIILRGSGREYRELPSIIDLNRPILVPVDFPDAPNVKSPQAREEVTLQDLMHWDLAPENPARLVGAGLAICLTTDGLSDVGQFLKQVRKAVDRGLSKEAALAAMTTVPAQLLGIESQVGCIEVGKLANFAIADGDLFDSDSKVLECWVAGKRFEITSPPNHSLTGKLVGDWTMKFRATSAPVTLNLSVTEKGDKLEGKVTPNSADEPNTEAADELEEADEVEGDDDDSEVETDDESNSEQGKKDAKLPSARLKDLARERDRITATINLHDVDPSLVDGVSLLSVIFVKGAPESEQEQPELFASIALPDGQTSAVELRRRDPISSESPKEESQDVTSEGPAADGEREVSDEEAPRSTAESSSEQFPSGEVASAEVASAEDSEKVESGPTPYLLPLGAYGLEQPISEQPTVLFRGATLWTCDEAGVLQEGDLLIQDGAIVAVGVQLDAPPGCQIIDARGKHITPGLIDCHSHMGTDGGVNESGQAVTAEVRIGDFLDNSDMNIYRQLAGGLTTSNILHGSANPIGGQNQVIKLRWGQTMDGLRMQEAPPGIKFALGENVKRNQSRYPNTRMGVEQIIRDQLLAAREYRANWRRWREGNRGVLPPRVDLQLEALAEVQDGDRWIHCHSYRQDEIVATLAVLEEFGIQIGTLQHILEGYKVADRMAQHGAMGSAFSDWWAYKFEVFDAIPYNGALMHEAGVVVSFNSDDRELARHMNTEAAKATKYGGVAEEEALKFVTLNPARQLRIDQHVGSLTPGKHADLVVWSGRPLSTLSRCEQTWIDGRRYFDLKSDAEMRNRDAQLRAHLIQKALGAGGASKSSAKDDEIAEEDRWVRTDIYCATHGGLRHETINSGEEQ
jgi:N-acetylglucosamine-6-phosphate deacetylase